MSKKSEKTLVDSSKFEALILESGLPFLAQAGYVKVSGATGRNVYFARSKRCGRVNLSGFEVSMPGVLDLGDLSFGSVRQEIDFTRPEAEIIETVRDVLAHLATLPAAPPVERKGRSRKDDGAIGWTRILPAQKEMVEEEASA